MVVRYDQRGHGLSEREVSDFSLEARMADLTAVVDHVSPSSVDLLLSTLQAPIGIAFAAANPDKVRRLILWRGRILLLRPDGVDEILDRLIEVDWPFYVRTQAMRALGWNETGLQVGEASVDSVTPEVFAADLRAHREYDVTDLLTNLRCPALVMHPKRLRSEAEFSKGLASTIPNARLVMFEQTNPWMFGGEGSYIIEQFLDEEEPQEKTQPLPPGMSAILFADIADSTGLTERLGDAAFRDKARELGAALRTMISEHSGTPIEGKLLGDGVLAVFTSARQAIEAALACGRTGDDAGLALHLGLHAGDVIREDNNVYGGAVNIASRISGLSAPGEVLVSDIVRGLARTSAGVRFEDRGDQPLKGVGEPVRVWAVREGE